MNKAIFIGNLTHDAEQKTSGQGKPYAQFTIAVNNKYGGKEETLFVTCYHLGKFEGILPYLKKGAKLMAEGRISARAYTDKQGNPQPSLSLVVNTVELLSAADKPNAMHTTEQVTANTPPFKEPAPQKQYDLPF